MGLLVVLSILFIVGKAPASFLIAITAKCTLHVLTSEAPYCASASRNGEATEESSVFAGRHGEQSGFRGQLIHWAGGRNEVTNLYSHCVNSNSKRIWF